MPSDHRRRPAVPDRPRTVPDRLRALLASVGGGALAVLLLLVAAPSLTPSYPDSPDAQAAAPVQSLDPEGSTPGGCLALPPTGGDRGRTVLLDAGHGAPDPGSIGTTGDGRSFPEKDVTLPVAVRAAQELRARGYRVAMTRTRDDIGVRLTDEDRTAGALTVDGLQRTLSARAECANRAGADALVSVHFNAFDDPGVGGVETLFDTERPFAGDSERLATELQGAMLRAYADLGASITDRGVLGGGESGAAEAGDLVVLAPSRPGSDRPESAMPGAVVEPLFITNPDEADLITSEAGQDALAVALADGADAFLRSTP